MEEVKKEKTKISKGQKYLEKYNTKDRLDGDANCYLKHTKSSKGITLIALVVTIIVLLILAGVSINIVLGDKGILNYDKDSGDKIGMAVVKEKIETLIVNWKADKIVDSSVTVERFWDDLEKAEIIDDKETDVSDPESSTETDGTKIDIYEVTTVEGYLVDIIITEEPNGEINISIGNIELITNLKPRVKITFSNLTTNGVTVKAKVRRAEGKLVYLYKLEDETQYTKYMETEETEITITGLEENKIYEIKVEASNKNGTVSTTEKVKIIKLEEGIIKLEEKEWNKGISTSSSAYKMIFGTYTNTSSGEGSQYWLASKAVHTTNAKSAFTIRFVYRYGWISNGSLWFSSVKEGAGGFFSVRAVVAL